MKRARDLGDQPPQPHFMIDSKIAEKPTYGKNSHLLLTTFTGTLLTIEKAQRDPLLTLLCEDEYVVVEFASGVLSDTYAPAETFLFVEIGNVYVEIEDLNDSLLCHSFPWNEVKKTTKFKILIRLSSKWLQKSGNPGAQLGDLIHEYSLHGIPFAQFINFVRGCDNLGGEVAFHYFYHSRSGSQRYLDTLYHHSSHGAGKKTLPSSSPSSWEEYSGNAYYNRLIKLFVTQKPDVQTTLMKAAIEDIKKQAKDPTAPARSYQPPKQVTEITLSKLLTKEGTMYALLKDFALCSYGKDPSALEKIVVTLQCSPHFLVKQWGTLLNACNGFFMGISGNLFGLDETRINAVMVLASETPAGKGTPYTLVCPQPRELTEAWIVYVAYGGYEQNLGKCQAFAKEVALDFDDGDWKMLLDYITYRTCLGHLLKENTEVVIWEKAAKVLPDLQTQLKKKGGQ